MKPIARPLAPTLLAAAIALATGCPSPEPGEKFDRFLDDTEEERESSAVDQGGALADINGTFLFALASFLAPEAPLQFYTTVMFTDNGDGTGMASLSMQPLSLDIGSAIGPREFVGDPLEIPEVAIDANGAFVIDIMEMVMLPGEANPITGSPIVTTRLTLSGNIQDTDLFCGVATGMVIMPLETSLDGSTFAAERVDAPDPAGLPMPPLGKCPDGGGGGGEDSGSGGSESGSGSGSGTGG
jgi:hypothetical protein